VNLKISSLESGRRECGDGDGNIGDYFSNGRRIW